jgi:hypothetical protein
MNRKARGFILLLMCGLFVNRLQAQAGSGVSIQCTQVKQLGLEKEASELRNWPSLYKSYRTYRTCPFDADAAEGYSESVARILVDHWDSVSEGAKLFRNDRTFEKFVFGALNDTLADADLERIRSLSNDSCPSGMELVCKRFRARVDYLFTSENERQ